MGVIVLVYIYIVVHNISSIGSDRRREKEKKYIILWQ